MIAQQIDNFFELPQVIYNEAKKIKLFKNADHPEVQNDINKSVWPGERSLELEHSNPLLKYFCVKYFTLNKLNIEDKKIHLYVHSRTQSDEKDDFIHTDACIYSLIIYISETNLKSGTKLFCKDNNTITDFKFVQNRLILFDSTYKHSAYGHHGNDINDSRLTINGFIR